MQHDALAHLILRLAIASVLLWFGLDNMLHPLAWSGYVPHWLPVDAVKFTFYNGIGEVILGIFLAIGLFTRIAAILAALHVLTVIVAVGYRDIAVRDFTIMLAAVSLALTKPSYALDCALGR